MKTIKYIVLTLVLAIIGFAIVYLGPRLPVISGFAAKNMCSCVYLSGRTQASVESEELGKGLLSMASNTINEDQKTVTSTVFGFGKQTAVYREGLGCTLVNSISPEALRQQAYTPVQTMDTVDYDTIPFPYGSQIVLSDSTTDLTALNQLLDQQFGESLGTRAVVVVKDGQILAEKYAEGYDADTRQLGWSMAKSVTNAMFGLRVGKSKLAISTKPDISAWQQDERKAITHDHLLRMSSGLHWEEDYSDLSDATRLLYKRDDMFGYAITAPYGRAPGEEWYYSSGTSNILSGLIRQSFDDQETYLQFPKKELFDKIGMRSAIFEPDADGTFVGSSYVWATPRDWARFGLLYLNDGIWDNERILPSGWVGYSVSPAPASKGLYGAQIWLNKSSDLPAAPTNMFYFRGYQGQRVFVLPSHNMVVVRLGISEDNYDFNALLKDVLALVTPAN
ncbi:MAG: beta-lactamase family protein [Saprospiraceae bacterium]|nr:beta-lactamase family protein [Saprospiraceae bacterium]